MTTDPELLALRHTIGWALRWKRKKLGLTLAKLSAKSGVSLGYLSQVELAKNVATVETLWRVCKALEIPMSFLFSVGARQKYEEAMQSPFMHNELAPEEAMVGLCSE